MPLGSKRPGAGRKPGGANKKTRAIADAAAAQGITPIEVMLNAMRIAWNSYQEPEHKLEYLHNAVAWADKAAPYVHPRLQTVAHSGSVDGQVSGKLTVVWGDGT